MKNKTFLAAMTLSASLFLAACGNAASDSASDSSTADATEPVKVTLGVVGEVNEPWDYVIEELKEKENIEVELVKFTDYTTPNNALAEGEIDLSSFQTEIFMDNYNRDHGTELTTIGYTVMAPLGLYSEKITSINELKDGDTIAIPNDVSNEGRALILLQTAGLIKLDTAAGLVPTTEDVVENRLNLQFQTLESNQTARALQDVTASVINSGMAVDAGFIPSEDAVFLEPVTEDSKPYYNVIAALAEDVDNEVFQTIVAYYQSKERPKSSKNLQKARSSRFGTKQNNIDNQTITRAWAICPKPFPIKIQGGIIHDNQPTTDSPRSYRYLRLHHRPAPPFPPSSGAEPEGIRNDPTHQGRGRRNRRALHKCRGDRYLGHLGGRKRIRQDHFAACRYRCVAFAG